MPTWSVDGTRGLSTTTRLNAARKSRIAEVVLQRRDAWFGVSSKWTRCLATSTSLQVMHRTGTAVMSIPSAQVRSFRSIRHTTSRSLLCTRCITSRLSFGDFIPGTPNPLDNHDMVAEQRMKLYHVCYSQWCRIITISRSYQRYTRTPRPKCCQTSTRCTKWVVRYKCLHSDRSPLFRVSFSSTTLLRLCILFLRSTCR